MAKRLTFKFDQKKSADDVDHYRLVEMENIFPGVWCNLFTPQGEETEEIITLYLDEIYSGIEIKSIVKKFYDAEYKFVK